MLITAATVRLRSPEDAVRDRDALKITFCVLVHPGWSSQGGGKSSLAKALCGEAREHLDAHVELVDCKRLQGQVKTFPPHSKLKASSHILILFLFHSSGKRLEAVRQIFQDAFEEAEWRQPSVLLLDDLDKVAGAPTSPEHAQGPEAVLQHHVAQSKPVLPVRKRSGGVSAR